MKVTNFDPKSFYTEGGYFHKNKNYFSLRNITA